MGIENIHTVDSPAHLKRLWLNVLLQVIRDASCISAKYDAHALRSAARSYLTNNHEDFREVCENAGLNPDTVYRASLRIFRSESPELFLHTLLPQTRRNGLHVQSRRGPAPKTIHDYLPKPQKDPTSV